MWSGGGLLLILLVGTGIYLSLRLGLLQVFVASLSAHFTRDQGEGDISSFGIASAARQRQLGQEILSNWRRLFRQEVQVPSLDVDGARRFFWDGDQVCRKVCWPFAAPDQDDNGHISVKRARKTNQARCA